LIPRPNTCKTLSGQPSGRPVIEPSALASCGRACEEPKSGTIEGDSLLAFSVNYVAACHRL
jgi:hypothetical protein